ncbi:enamine deaminase RidA (YjgF/YER057c/UK114 family) [Sphingopyxis sp. OAS728]|uniref:RidA family protein n=1 Tax=Sphingopyxis sp. OAS728 TaxID=2663823 RepID=UPI0017891689|nr:RidA family protein [Sphingopyxis sp. OAS728]MBE1528945.1 enamine deaminase RidA (YjgF/YER057c/UK114 family) [Sphingopyxis sp. OAS728]
MAGQPISPTEASYAQAWLAEMPTRWLFVSGQVPTDSDGDAPSSFADQARVVWRNLETQLHAANMNLSDIAKLTVYLSSRDYRQQNTQIRREILGAHCPAITVIIADIFDSDWLLEVDAIACR